jgi:pimeloyl-ACP methyl ester carboxylesterase
MSADAARVLRVRSDDGIELHAEDSGDLGASAVVFVHEFAGSCRSFDAQVAALRARYRCIAFNARGYPPSQVPALLGAYSEARAADDIVAVLDGLGVDKAHLVGVSMGAAAALQCALRRPGRVRSLTLVGIGTGSDGEPAQVQASLEAIAATAERDGPAALAQKMAASPTRWRLREKQPEEFERFVAQMGGMSAQGAAFTMRGVQQRRRPLYEHGPAIARLALPALVVVGGEDAGCLGPSRFLQQQLRGARLEVVPATGHAVNLEEPAAFNRLCLDFLAEVDAPAARGGPSAATG